MNLYRRCVIAVVQKGLPFDGRRLPATVSHDLNMCERFADAALFAAVDGGDPLRGAGPSSVFTDIVLHGSTRQRGAALLSWAYDFFGRLIVFPEKRLCDGDSLSWLVGAGKLLPVFADFAKAHNAHANCAGRDHRGFRPMSLYAGFFGFDVESVSDIGMNLAAAKDLWRALGVHFADWPCYRGWGPAPRDLIVPFINYEDAFLPLEPELHKAVCALRDIWDLDSPGDAAHVDLKPRPVASLAAVS